MNARMPAFLQGTQRFGWFLIGVTILKILAMGFFSSDYQYKLFMPFVNTFLEHNIYERFNPYEYYYAQHLGTAFPYPPLMLYIESVGAALIKVFDVSSLFWQNIFFKLPNLLCDLLTLYYLMKLYPHCRRDIGFLYFASPIIFYAAYMHGQLDVIPTAFLIASLYYLFSKNKYSKVFFTIFLAFSLTTKLHILAVVPVLFIYLLKREYWLHSIMLISASLVISFLMMFPFIGTGFFESVLFNNEQSLLTKVYLSFVDLKLYLPVLAVLFIYLQEFVLATINRDLLLSFCGLLFTVFVALLPPMPGWYVWIVPFVVIFFISVKVNRRNNLYIYVALNIAYVLYFVFYHQTTMVDLYFLTVSISPWVQVHNEVLRNLVFTFLSGLLIYTAISMYRLGIASNIFYKRKALPFTIGIAGDSGAGKSTLIQFIKNNLGEKNLLFIEGDGDHKWQRGEAMWNIYTHLNPKANYLYRQAMDIQMLRKGIAVRRVEYDHHTGCFTEEKKVQPNKYIVFSGLHSFYLPQMRKALDLKIYMDTDDVLRRYWKIQRDVQQRGYNSAEVQYQLDARVKDAERYIIPQKNYADMVIHYFDKTLKNCWEETHKLIISLTITLSSEVNIEPFVRALAAYQVEVAYDYTEDLRKQMVTFDGASLLNKYIPFQQLAEATIPQLDELTHEDFFFVDNISGIIQMMIFINISQLMQGELKE